MLSNITDPIACVTVFRNVAVTQWATRAIHTTHDIIFEFSAIRNCQNFENQFFSHTNSTSYDKRD